MKIIALKDPKGMTRADWVAACDEFMRVNNLNQKQFLKEMIISKKCFQHFKLDGECFDSTFFRIAFMIGGLPTLVKVIPFSPKTPQGKVWIYMAINGLNQSEMARKAELVREDVWKFLHDEWIDVSVKAKIISVARISLEDTIKIAEAVIAEVASRKPTDTRGATA